MSKFLPKMMEDVLAIKGFKREYYLEVKRTGRRIINATAGVCPVHIENIGIGRLGIDSVAEANVKSTDIPFFAQPNQRVVVLRRSNQSNASEL